MAALTDRDEDLIAALLEKLSPDELKAAVDRAALPPTDSDCCRRCGDFLGRCFCPPILPKSPISLEVWEPDPARPPYLKRVRTRTFREVWDHIRPQLAPYWDEGMDIAPELHHRHIMDTDGFHVEDEIPEGIRWVSAWCVPGSNEGHYVYVELVRANGAGRIPFLMGKTFRGLEHGFDLCRRTVELIECC